MESRLDERFGNIIFNFVKPSVKNLTSLCLPLEFQEWMDEELINLNVRFEIKFEIVRS